MRKILDFTKRSRIKSQVSEVCLEVVFALRCVAVIDVA